ncbi:hypothetical protein C7M84_025575 [Penaeus vannamei]|uniref:Uncharacterized protein n=1 Tax=Penaeus vannamei TaxID=6689 RepID=A0A423TXU4_PENVA|nr:hypothetical protein C7M84_025575 [Penaeus vannamei]
MDFVIPFSMPRDGGSQCHSIQSFAASRARMAALFQVLAVALLSAYASSQLHQEPEHWQDDYVSDVCDHSDTHRAHSFELPAFLPTDEKQTLEEGIDEEVISLLLSELIGDDEDEEHESEEDTEEEQVVFLLSIERKWVVGQKV